VSESFSLQTTVGFAFHISDLAYGIVIYLFPQNSLVCPLGDVEQCIDLLSRWLCFSDDDTDLESGVRLDVDHNELAEGAFDSFKERSVATY
jgi:hypothetical protein